ncbi:hypothetical protein PAPHI01_0647 [Pancytospora philotis]|nr:hypothetical protein PAPHI01_0647 [Pancytospora philotis]
MNVYCGLFLVLTLLLALFSLSGSAISMAGRDQGQPSLPRLTHEQFDELFFESLAQIEEENKMDKKIDRMLFQCFYAGQPVVPESERAKGSLPILHKVCDECAFVGNITQQPRRFRRGRYLFQAGKDREEQDERGEVVELENSESGESVSDDTLHSVFLNAKYGPRRAYAKADPTALNTTQQTDADAEGPRHALHGLVSVMYDKLRNRRPADPNSKAPKRMLSPIGFYYLKSKPFDAFLAAWKKSRSNSMYYISREDVNRILDEVDYGTPFSELSDYDKRLFTKLVFVRNTLETYGTIRAVMEPLGLRSNEHRTAEEFLQAMYGYLLAVHESDGKLTVPYPVAMNILTIGLFNLAYADCCPHKISSIRGGKEVVLEYFMADKMHLFIEGVIILFKAWCRSSKTNIDPAVVSAVTDGFYSFVNHSENYDDGCQEAP